MLDKLGREGQTILYHVMRNGFFAINAGKKGRSEYLRYHQDGAGLLGFTLLWQSDDAPLYGNRISVLISASLSNQILGTPMPALPRYEVANIPGHQAPPRKADLLRLQLLYPLSCHPEELFIPVPVCSSMETAMC